MEAGGSMQHSQWHSNNPCPEPNQLLELILISLRFILILSLCLGLPKSLFPVGVLFKNLKAFLSSSILAI